jgi:hypothetical protein
MFIASAWPPPKGLPEGIGTIFINTEDIRSTELGSAIYGGFLPAALASGQYIAAPEPQTVGKDLKVPQEGLELVLKGVLAQKIVVSFGSRGIDDEGDFHTRRVVYWLDRVYRIIRSSSCVHRCK